MGDYFKTNIPQFSATRTVGRGSEKSQNKKSGVDMIAGIL